MRIITNLIGRFSRLYSTLPSTMKYLNVAEKPTAAKTISQLLSNGSARRREGLSVYNKIFEFETSVKGKQCKMVMTSVSGHLLNYEFNISYKNWRNCDPQQLFEAPISKRCLADFEKLKKTLEREIKSCHGLIIWTDCDREGENIGFEIIDVCKAIKPSIQVFRAKFSDITTNSVKRALANLVQPDIRQSQAVDVRQELDLRIGAAFTRYQTMRLQQIFPEAIAEKLISYGSCQIPTLGFVAQRYKEAEEFVSEPFWKIKVIHTIDDLTVDFHWARNRLFDKETCEDYLMLCLENPTAKVDSVTVKPKNKWRPTPMDTVQLEKLGSRKLKINAKETMTIAEKLYTQGYISYPRTETNIFSKEVDLRSLVQQHTPHPEWGQFASKVLEWGPNPRNGQKSDQAHPPIHPTKFATGLNGNEARIYELVVRHFLACVSKDATGSETIVNITIAGEKFSANGLVIYERNYLDVYPYEKWNAKLIHNYVADTTFEPTEISMQEGQTTAPPLLTEADLIALMEKHGIGTDATHAEHIHKIKERGYIGEVDKGLLVPGTIGMGLFEGYGAMELTLAQPVLRAEFEVDLKKVCTGERNPQDVLKEQIVQYKQAYRVITEKFRAFQDKMAGRLNESPQDSAVQTISARIEEVLKCPKCNKCSMALKQKRDNAGYYISCLGFPDCKNAVWFPDDIKEVKVTDIVCRKCGPGYHKIEVKFKQMNYLILFNATGNSYTTCIVCDAKFREEFCINIDTVKRVGPITGTTNITSTTAPNRPPLAGINNARQTVRSAESSVNSRYTGWGLDDDSNGNNQPRSSNIRNNPNIIANTENHHFDDDDEVFQSTDWDNIDVENDAGTGWDFGSAGSATYRNNGASSNNELFSSSRNQQSNRPPSGNNNSSTNKVNSSWSNIRNSLAQNENRFNTPASPTNDVLKCTCQELVKEFTVKKDGPNKGRQFYSCGKTPRVCGFFQWVDGNEQVTGSSANSSSNTSNRSQDYPRVPNPNTEREPSSDVIICTGCQNPAKLLTVRKDGPNKGRPFYGCPNIGGTCNFFKWADEDVGGSSGGPSTSWGSNSNSNRDQPSTSSATTTGPKKRKCGLCREEGHTKTKCPRKSEFEY